MCDICLGPQPSFDAGRPTKADSKVSKFLASDDVLKLLFTASMHFWEKHVIKSPCCNPTSVSDDALAAWMLKVGKEYDQGCQEPYETKSSWFSDSAVQRRCEFDFAI
jgi:hypothetical protein